MPTVPLGLLQPEGVGAGLLRQQHPWMRGPRLLWQLGPCTREGCL